MFDPAELSEGFEMDKAVAELVGMSLVVRHGSDYWKRPDGSLLPRRDFRPSTCADDVLPVAADVGLFENGWDRHLTHTGNEWDFAIYQVPAPGCDFQPILFYARHTSPAMCLCIASLKYAAYKKESAECKCDGGTGRGGDGATVNRTP